MYRKYKISGCHDIQTLKQLEKFIKTYNGIIHCSINKNTLFIDSKNMIDISDFNKYIKEFNSHITISDLSKKKNESVNHNDCGCGCNHNHSEHNDIEEDHRILGNSIKFTIKGLDCPNCAMKVEKAINDLDYVNKAVLNFTTQTLMVQSHEKDLLLKLQNIIDSIENGVTLSKEKAEIEVPKLFVLKEQFNLVLGIICLVLSLFIKTQILHILFILFSYIIIGYPVLYKAFKNIIKGEVFDENFLMCIATIGALCIGEYFEAVAVMLFYSIGEIFQSYAVNKTRYSIHDLMNIKSEYAYVLEHNEYIKKKPEEVKIGDIIVVKVGEKIPLDGIVVEGSTTLDTSSMTGESMPRLVKENDEVLASMINLSDVIYIRVTKRYEDTAVSKIIDLMENAALVKAPIERFITRFAKIYTPSVVVMALLLAVIPPFIFKDTSFYEWLYRALTFLVVSCPCALVVSIPLGLYAGIGKASQVGALVKGGNYLEYLKEIDTVVFDKTGTLTKGKFEVIDIIGDSNVLEIASAIESMSNHPISKSIVSYYGKKNNKYKITDFKEIAGKGIECLLDSKKYYIGNANFLKEHHIIFDEVYSLGSVVYVADENHYLGAIVLEDEIKQSSYQGIVHLKEAGIKKTVMLSGDKKDVACDIGVKLGLDLVYSDLLPCDKVTRLEELIENHKVAFVGDGINDAPVLARANIGIAMGGTGSDAAVEAADIVLMNDDIDTIVKTIHISKKTNMILKQNVIFTLVIKLSVLLLTMLGYSNMWMGVFADVGVTLIAIMNSLRILK